ncbi:MAG: SulP family inorganic anion transporter [Planctomycetota bacterium]|nr:MAG: SulP family inorganic anion transporter [Planctomycetota bacterium]
MKKSTGYTNLTWSEIIAHDLPASIVVFLVALPLCMGIAIASGVPVAAGLITGIVGGIVVGALSGCPLQVSGPAAGLTVIVYEIVQKYGLETLGIIVLVAGAIQLVAGACKLGQWFRAVSPAVIKGMLAGIGVLIFSSQFHVMVDDRPKSSGIENLITIPQAIIKGLAIPEFNDAPSRRFRRDMLQETGEVHRRQISLHERLAERIPHQIAHGPAADQERIEAIDPQELQPFVEEQREIVSQLASVVMRLEEFETTDQDSDRAKRIHAAAQTALTAALAAQQALESGAVADILATQVAVEQALQEFLNSQKNHHLAALLGLLTITVLLLWQAFARGRLKVIPGPLAGVIAGTVFAAGLTLPVVYVEIPDNLLDDLHFPSWEVVQSVSWMEILQAGLLIAVVASAETLLCATAVDQMHQGPRTRYDKELMAQGVGNMICGVLGALPMTGVIVRSSANVLAGARTRFSAILHGVWLLVFVAGLTFVLRNIPTSALAAILVYTGYKLVNPKSIKELWEFGVGEVLIYLATVATIVFTDLLTGVVVGIILAALKLLNAFAQLYVRLEPIGEDRVRLELSGAATFVRLPRLARGLERVPAGAVLEVDASRLSYIDHACLDLLRNWSKQHETTGGRVEADWDLLKRKFLQRNGAAEA